MGSTGPYLQRVTGEVGLFVPPHALGGNHQHHDTEDEEHRQPDFPQTGGVAVDTGQLGVQSRPRHPEQEPHTGQENQKSVREKKKPVARREGSWWQEMKPEAGGERRLLKEDEKE